MGNSIQQVRTHVLDVLRATRAMLPVVVAQLRSPEIDADPQVRWIVEKLLRMLNAHADELVEHLQRLGGGALLGEIEIGHGTAHRISIAKALREDFAALSLDQAGLLVLEINSRALGYSSTAALAARHREEIAAMLESIREAMPIAA